MSLNWEEVYGTESWDDLLVALDMEKLTVNVADTTSHQQLDPSTYSPTSVAAIYEWRENQNHPEGLLMGMHHHHPEQKAWSEIPTSTYYSNEATSIASSTSTPWLPIHTTTPSSFTRPTAITIEKMKIIKNNCDHLCISFMDHNFMPPIGEDVADFVDSRPSHFPCAETDVLVRPRTESDSSASYSTCSWSSFPEPAKKIYVCDEEIEENDVLFGRGGRSNLHPGNEAYRRRILANQPVYKALNDKKKKLLSEGIVHWVKQELRGRFLAVDETPQGHGRYYVATDRQARKKASQALREDHTPEGRALKKSRQNKAASRP